MRFHRSDADILVPGGTEADEALARTTHLCVAAHPDDIEIMAYQGIVECHGRTDRFFTGVVVTDGAGSPRSGPYAGLTDTEMREVRRREQRSAAQIGKYNLQIQLAHPSADVKQPGHPGVAADLLVLFAAARPGIVYLHNPADKHDTHVAVFLRCLEALRALPLAARPERVLGCEVWRGLDWLSDDEKVALDSSSHPELAEALLKAFDSQVAGGKRYDLATLGRRLANATFHASHRTDAAAAVTWAVDLTPLVNDEARPINDFVLARIDRFRTDVSDRLKRFGG